MKLNGIMELNLDSDIWTWIENEAKARQIFPSDVISKLIETVYRQNTGNKKPSTYESE